jgi:peptidoglycan-associated lipoprotein
MGPGSEGMLLDQPMDGALSDRPVDPAMLPGVKYDHVFFDYDSAQIRESERAKVEAVADFLRKNPRAGVIIAGHCDERGSREYNMALGERRALAVRQYLVGLGINASVIQTVSYGEENPAAFGTGESVWSQNRRAEFSFFAM